MKTITYDESQWQLVPKSVTREMQKAYFDVIDKNMPRVMKDARFGRWDSHREAYKAMLAAALASPADALVAGDRVDAERTGTLYQAVQRAAGELPEGWTICLEIERDAGTVELIDPEGNRKLIDGNDGYLCQAVNEATNAAIQAQKDGQ